MKKINVFLYLMFLLGLIFFSVTTVFAETPTPSPSGSPSTSSSGGSGKVEIPGPITVSEPANLPSQFKDINKTFNFAFDLIVGISGTVFIIMLLVGGIQYLTSMGNEEAASKAKKTLIFATIGIIVVAVSWAVGSLILTRVNLNK